MMDAVIAWDKRVTQRLRGKPSALKPFMIFLTVLGEPTVIMPVLTVGGLLALLDNHNKIGLVLLLACLSSVLNLGLNFAIHRQRPSTPFARAMAIKTYSFPSEHAFTALLALGLVAYAGVVCLSVPVAILVVTLMGCFVCGIGFSRIYLGAHFVLDVVCGWLLGAGVLALLIRMLR